VKILTGPLIVFMVSLAAVAGPGLVEVVPRKDGQPLGSHLLLLVDVSGSMTDTTVTAFGRALGAAEEMLGRTDGAHGGVIAWGTRAARWEPSGAKKKWAKLPDLLAVKEAQAWLRGMSHSLGGGTNLRPALRLALKDPAKDLSIVVLSDGHLHDKTEWLLEDLKTGQAERRRRGLSHAVVAVLGIPNGSIASLTTHSPLARLARAGGGGMWRYR